MEFDPTAFEDEEREFRAGLVTLEPPEEKEMALEYLARPPLAASSGPPPALVLLHGFGSNEQDLFSLAPYLDPRLYIVAVRAPIALPFGGRAWFEIDFLADGIAVDVEQAMHGRAILLRFLEEVVPACGLDPRRLYLLGFSQGASMAVDVALTHPERVVGVAAMSGCLLPGTEDDAAPAESLSGLPFFVCHGAEDPVLPVDLGRALRDRLAALRVDLAYREYAMGHEVSPESLDDVAAWISDHLNR